jgi:hypothetical protein
MPEPSFFWLQSLFRKIDRVGSAGLSAGRCVAGLADSSTIGCDRLLPDRRKSLADPPPTTSETGSQANSVVITER